MEYIPGQIHESFQKKHYYELGYSFHIPYFENTRMVDSDILDNTVGKYLYPGDVIVIRYFKSDLYNYAT